MSATRRDFLQQSAAAATAAALNPLSAAAESISAAEVRPSSAPDNARILARAVPSERVRVLGGPLKQAQDLTAKYLLELEPDRMLAYYRLRAGLPQRAEPYTGWDGGGRNLTSIARFEPNAKATGFYDARYAVPADVVRGKSKVTVRFQSAPDGRVAPVFGVRTVRAYGE
jgi:hypothetical protein